MGLFVLDLKSPANSTTRVEAAIANLELYLEQNNPDYDYLILIAQSMLDDAIRMAGVENEDSS